MIEYVYLLIMILCTVVGQMLIKVASTQVTISFKTLNLKTILNPWLLSGVFITFIAPLFYFLALKKLDLSVAFAFSSLNYALVMIASIVLLKEKISLSKIVGTSIIVIGILLFSIKF